MKASVLVFVVIVLDCSSLLTALKTFRWAFVVLLLVEAALDSSSGHPLKGFLGSWCKGFVVLLICSSLLLVTPFENSVTPFEGK